MSFYQRVVSGIAVDMFGPAPDFLQQKRMASGALDEVCRLIDRARAQPLGGGLVVPLEKIAGIIAHQLGGPEHDEEWVSRSRTAASHLWDKVAGWLPLQPGGGEGSASPGTRELLGKPDPRIHPAYLKATKAMVDFHFGRPEERTSIQPAGASAASVGERRQGFVPWEALDDEQRARIREVMLDQVSYWDTRALWHRYPDPRLEMAREFSEMLQWRATEFEQRELFPRRMAALAGQLVEARLAQCGRDQQRLPLRFGWDPATCQGQEGAGGIRRIRLHCEEGEQLPVLWG